MSERSLNYLLIIMNWPKPFLKIRGCSGIMAPVKDYQFCWHLNSLLGMDFRINHEIEIELKKKKTGLFFFHF